jgi:hypothetical protein
MAAREHARPSAKRRRIGSSAKQWAQVLLATVLVAGAPVALVWWLRASDTVTSPLVGAVVGMASSLLLSQLGRLVWESRRGSEDLLFNELMLWGFVQRRRHVRRLASAIDMVGPMSEGRRVTAAIGAKQQAKLLERLVANIETRDPYLHGHSRRVARYAWTIAKRMGLEPSEVARVRTAAAIHDVGKIETPLAILHKPGTLSDEEYATVKRHPEDGARMVSVLRDSELTKMVRHHHERLDGTGYPQALSGHEIPLGARIIAVADTFDAITSVRPYRGASPHKLAIDILKVDAGTRLDPEVVSTFCSVYAGRRPIAVWSIVTSLPERAASWLLGSLGSVASSAKMVALAAIVGGTAASTSALAGPATHPPMPASPTVTHAQYTTRTSAAGGAQVTGSSAHAAAGPNHTSATHTARRAPATSTASTAPAVDASRASIPAGAAIGQGPASHPGSGLAGANPTSPSHGAIEVSGKGKAQEGAGQGAEAPGKVKAEGHGKSSEAPGKATGESPGKSGEAPGHNRTDEAAGKSGEAPGRNKPEDAAGKNEAPGQSKPEEPAPKAEEAHGKSEVAHGNS